MLSVICVKCGNYAHNAERHFTECRNLALYAECHYAECRSDVKVIFVLFIICKCVNILGVSNL